MLLGLPEGHQCGRLHGHTYHVTVELVAQFADSNGWVFDYGALKPFKDLIDERLDHQYLNDVLGFQTTAELMAEYLYGAAHHVLVLPEGVTISKVTVRETENTYAEYSAS
jgi:6-pyruvoyltetrahydropterin/6-carboxytetrahydropterin synthase